MLNIGYVYYFIKRKLESLPPQVLTLLLIWACIGVVLSAIYGGDYPMTVNDW